MRKTLTTAAMAVAVLLSACASTQSKNDVPALRITSPGGRSSTLIGSAHSAVEGLREPDVEALFKDARIYVVEGVPGDGPEPEPRRPRFGMLKNGQLVRARWASALTPEEVQTFATRLQCNPKAKLAPGTDVAKASHRLLSMGDPVSALGIAVLRCAPPGTVSRDDLLARAAAERGLATVGLERAVDVEAKRFSIDEDTYAHLLKAALQPGNEVDMERLAVALNNAEYDEILSIMAAPVPASAAQRYRDVMVDERNVEWMSRLRPLLEEGGAVINVGAAHLGGTNGLIALLESRGYAVEAMLVPAATK